MIENCTLKSTYFFFLLLCDSNTLLHQDPAPLLAVFSLLPAYPLTWWWHLPLVGICPNLHQSKSRSPMSPGHLREWCEVGTMYRFRCPKPCLTQMSTAGPQPSKICLPAASSPIFQPAHKVKLSPFQFVVHQKARSRFFPAKHIKPLWPGTLSYYISKGRDCRSWTTVLSIPNNWPELALTLMGFVLC